MSIVAKQLYVSAYHYWYADRPQPRRHCVRWGPSSLPQRGTSPIFGPYLLWPYGWMDQDGTWHGGGPWHRSHCARWEPSSSSPKRGRSPFPKFSANFYCRQTVRCIKMPLVMEVGLSPGDFVLDGDPAPPQKGGGTPQFWPMSILAKQLRGSRCHLVQR